MWWTASPSSREIQKAGLQSPTGWSHPGVVQYGDCEGDSEEKWPTLRGNLQDLQECWPSEVNRNIQWSSQYCGTDVKPIEDVLMEFREYLYDYHLYKRIHFMIFFSSRYIYIIAATSDTNFGRLAKWLTLNSNFHIYLTVLGLTMTAFHGISTIFLASDQFFFDQGKRRYFDQKRFCTEMYEKNFWFKIL